MENTEQEKKEVQETTSAQPQVQPQKPAHKKIKCKLSSQHLMWIAVAILALGVLGSYGYKQYRTKVDIGPDAAKEKIQKFLSENVPSTTKTEIKSIEANGSLYKVTIDIDKQEVPVFITRDGKKFIDPSGVRELEPKEAVDTKKSAQEQQKEIPKSEKPKVDLYVMSFCPFGNKAEDTLKPVYELLKNKVEFNFRYIVSSKGDSIDSLHGEPEVLENEREACVLKLYGKDQWMNFATYVNEKCGSKGECWEAGAKSLKIDVAKVNSCVKSDGVKLMKADEEKSKAANAQGSPTMLINGVSATAVYQYGNSEAYKKAICDAFSTAPAECAKTLSSETSTAQGGSCGN